MKLIIAYNIFQAENKFRTENNHYNIYFYVLINNKQSIIVHLYYKSCMEIKLT